MKNISIPVKQIISLQKAIHALPDNQFEPLEPIYENWVDVLNEIDILCSEVNLGNVIIKHSTLTCIHNNKLHRYSLVKRAAHAGDKIYITKYSADSPFNDKKYIGRCFIVANTPEIIASKDNAVSFAEIRAFSEDFGYEYSWTVLDDQYVVLEEYGSMCKIIPLSP